MKPSAHLQHSLKGPSHPIETRPLRRHAALAIRLAWFQRSAHKHIRSYGPTDPSGMPGPLGPVGPTLAPKPWAESIPSHKSPFGVTGPQSMMSTPPRRTTTGPTWPHQKRGPSETARPRRAHRPMSNMPLWGPIDTVNLTPPHHPQALSKPPAHLQHSLYGPPHPIEARPLLRQAALSICLAETQQSTYTPTRSYGLKDISGKQALLVQSAQLVHCPTPHLRAPQSH